MKSAKAMHSSSAKEWTVASFLICSITLDFLRMASPRPLTELSPALVRSTTVRNSPKSMCWSPLVSASPMRATSLPRSTGSCICCIALDSSSTLMRPEWSVSKAEKTARSSCTSASLRFFGRSKTEFFEGRRAGTAAEAAGFAAEAAAMWLSFTSDGALGGICGCAYSTRVGAVYSAAGAGVGPPPISPLSTSPILGGGGAGAFIAPDSAPNAAPWLPVARWCFSIVSRLP
mmetsp:Transcript_14868/g.35162  ORF Transcript_14868/g.35162 Transcript_14868/m.35162 type:complete len:231 (+) Transcript_14868:692-1384(+)